LIKACVFLGFILLLWGGGPEKGRAQFETRRGDQGVEQRADRETRPNPSAAQVPEWASPSTGSRSDQGRADGELRTKVGPCEPQDPSCGDGEDPTKEPIPLGGLEWLLLAGAGYGLFKLRDEG
jgi:hypothetical protein